MSVVGSFIDDGEDVGDVVTRVRGREFFFNGYFVRGPFNFWDRDLDRRDVHAVVFFRVQCYPCLYPFQVSIHAVSFFSRVASRDPNDVSNSIVVRAGDRQVDDQDVRETGVHLACRRNYVSIFAGRFQRAFDVGDMECAFLQTRTVVVPVARYRRVILPIYQGVFLRDPIDRPIPYYVDSNRGTRP